MSNNDNEKQYASFAIHLIAIVVIVSLTTVLNLSGFVTELLLIVYFAIAFLLFEKKNIRNISIFVVLLALVLVILFSKN